MNSSFPASQFSVTPSEYVTDSLVLKAIPQPSSSLINCSFSEVPVILVIVTVSADSLEDSSPPADWSGPAVSTELFSASSSVSSPTICSPSLSESSIGTSVSVSSGSSSGSDIAVSASDVCSFTSAFVSSAAWSCVSSLSTPVTSAADTSTLLSMLVNAIENDKNRATLCRKLFLMLFLLPRFCIIVFLDDKTYFLSILSFFIRHNIQLYNKMLTWIVHHVNLHKKTFFVFYIYKNGAAFAAPLLVILWFDLQYLCLLQTVFPPPIRSYSHKNSGLLLSYFLLQYDLLSGSSISPALQTSILWYRHCLKPVLISSAYPNLLSVFCCLLSPVFYDFTPHFAC